MVKEKTITNFIELLNNIKDAKMTISAYCEQNGMNKNSIYHQIQNIKNNFDKSNALYTQVIQLYNSIVNPDIEEPINITPVEYDEELRAGLGVKRDENGKIKTYTVVVPGNPKFITTLNRTEVEELFGLYTYYGGNITARNVSREFPKFTLSEVKKLFRAFGMTKDSAWFPPHLNEELTLEELSDYRMTLKEKAAFKYADARQERDFNNEIKKLASQINKLEDRNYILSSFAIAEPKEYKIPEIKVDSLHKALVLHVSDLHIGANVESGSMYQNNWTTEEIQKRLRLVLKQCFTLGAFEELHVNLLGDGIDGFDGLTARGGHVLPQNKDNLEQIQTYLQVMEEFFEMLVKSKLYKKIKVHAVRCGNHPGDAEYLLNQVLKAKLEAKYYNYLEFDVFETYFGHYKLDKYDYVICHGRDPKFHKKGMPLNLDDKNKVIIYDWLSSQGINGNDIQVIKGDLHTENINSSYRLTYRNVLSLFGASDYSMMNFTRNQVGVSYDMLIGSQLVRGTFEIK